MHVPNSIADDHRTAPDWQDLFPELLAAIAKRLTLFSDYTSFRGVCKSWRSASTFDNFDVSVHKAPWFMFTMLQLSKSRKLFVYPQFAYATNFLDLSKKAFKISHFPEEEELMIKFFSCSGWLLRVTGSSVHIHLTHLIRGTRVELPDLDSFPGFTNNLSNSKYYLHEPFIRKMVLSCSPTIMSDFVIMVIWGTKKQLGFSRAGDSAWTVMESWNGSFMDILYHKGKFYAIDDYHRVVECDIHGHNPTRMYQILSFGHHVVDKYMCYMDTCYMVESFGKFLIVLAPNRGLELQVIEFDLTNGSCKEIYDLGNRSLFLSRYSSSLCLEDFARNDEIKPNCIYFAHCGKRFHLGKGYSESIFERPFRMVGSPIWVVPGL